MTDTPLEDTPRSHRRGWSTPDAAEASTRTSGVTDFMESIQSDQDPPQRRDLFAIWSYGLTMVTAMVTGIIATVVIIGTTAFFIVEFLSKLVAE